MSDQSELDGRHWDSETYSQRMTRKQWREILLNDLDMITFRGCVRRLKARNIGYGVVEVYKEAKG